MSSYNQSSIATQHLYKTNYIPLNDDEIWLLDETWKLNWLNLSNWTWKHWRALAPVNTGVPFDWVVCTVTWWRFENEKGNTEGWSSSSFQCFFWGCLQLCTSIKDSRLVPSVLSSGHHLYTSFGMVAINLGLFEQLSFNLCVQVRFGNLYMNFEGVWLHHMVL